MPKATQIHNYDQDQALAREVLAEMADNYTRITHAGGTDIEAFRVLVRSMLHTIEQSGCGHPEHTLAHACELITYAAIEIAKARP